MLYTSQVAEAGLYAESGLVPLQDVSIFAEVIDVMSIVKVRQIFINSGAKPIEATYCFPLEADSAVCAFEAAIGDRRIKGVVEERDKAFKKYDQAIEKGDSAFLLDQERPNIFITSVGNIKPGEKVEVSLTYIKTLPVADDAIGLMIPATVSPRYVPGTADPVEADRISPPLVLNTPYDLRIEILLREASGIKAVSSPSHAIKMEKLEDDWKVLLSEDKTSLDRDFILHIQLKQPKAPFARIQENNKGDKAIMVRIYPEIEAFAERSPSEIIFLLDCSGSMEGSSIDQAKRVLELCLKSMAEGDSFNIVRFGSTFDMLFESSAAYSESSLNEAIRYVRRIDADLGGTELLAPLQHIFSKMPYTSNHKREIIVITDGQVSNEKEVIQLAGQHKDHTRIFSFGIGHGPSESLVKGLARVTRGMSEFVSPDESIEDKVLRQFSRIDSPNASYITIDWGGLEVHQVPAEIPPLFDGDSFTVYGLIKGGGLKQKISLSCRINGQEIKYPVPVSNLDSGNIIPTLWARNYIQELEDGTGYVAGSKQMDRKTKSIQKTMIEIGKHYQLMSSETSFVAVLLRPKSERLKEDIEYLRVPIQLTRDWHGTRAFMRSSGALLSKSLAAYSIGAMKYCLFDMAAPALKASQRVQAPKTKAPSWIMDLLLNQNAAGWFALSGKLAKQLGTTIEEIRDIQSRIKGAKKKDMLVFIIATALTILVFELKGKAFKELWKRAFKKAEKVLQKELADVTLDGKPLLERLREIFFAASKD